MKWKIALLYVGSLLLLAGLLFFAFLASFWFFFVSPYLGKEADAYPEKFTLEFEKELVVTVNGKPVVTLEGIEQLRKAGAWIQILDENGTEAFFWNKPPHAQTHYTPSELIFMYKYSVEGYTIFVSRKEMEGRQWNYVIGFPDKRIARHPLLFSPERFLSALPKQLWALAVSALISMLLIGYLFAHKLVKPVWHLIHGIAELSKGRYDIRLKPRGLYRHAYRSLNELAATLASHEVERKRLDAMREEWIANLSHDLKTPLSSIKGYAEVLADPNDPMDTAERVGYAGVIVKNVVYLETLLEDLKLTYQLKHRAIPIVLKKENLVELLRNCIIRLLNTPSYAGRDVRFEPDEDLIPMEFDAKWLDRAFTNLILNALVHNPAHCWVRVAVKRVSAGIEVTVEDNGKGIPEDDLEKLFERYYRGTNTESAHEGSGLGLAIARQIIQAHRGEIRVESSLGKGARVTVAFPSERYAAKQNGEPGSQAKREPALEAGIRHQAGEEN